MAINSFKEIIGWQKAHELVMLVYKTTDTFPKHELFCLTNQIRRAAISVPSNIAEGYKRRSNKDSVHFYNIAEGSLEELKYQLLLANDLGYIPAEQYKTLDDLSEETGRLLCGWIKSQKSSA